MPLTPKQTRFVEEYLVDLNATQAAIRTGYSRGSAEQQAYENLRKPEIAQAITAGKARQLEAAQLSAAACSRSSAASLSRTSAPSSMPTET
jgi:phage terminase small subunit